MNKLVDKDNSINKNEIPTLLIKFYGLMAVVFVLIPEWIAEFGVIIENDQFRNELPGEINYKENNIELFISSISLKELRLIASKLNLHCYSCDQKKILTKRVLIRLKTKKRINISEIL